MKRALCGVKPEVEVAESRVLLSRAGFSGPLAAPIQLQGEVQTTVTAMESGAGQGATSITGSGSIAPLGVVRMTSNLPVSSGQDAAASAQGHSTGTMVLKGSRGNLRLTVLSSGNSSDATGIPFIIAGGTGAFRNATGHGTIDKVVSGPASFQVREKALRIAFPLTLTFSS